MHKIWFISIYNGFCLDESDLFFMCEVLMNFMQWNNHEHFNCIKIDSFSLSQLQFPHQIILWFSCFYNYGNFLFKNAKNMIHFCALVPCILTAAHVNCMHWKNQKFLKYIKIDSFSLAILLGLILSFFVVAITKTIFVFKNAKNLVLRLLEEIDGYFSWNKKIFFFWKKFKSIHLILSKNRKFL